MWSNSEEFLGMGMSIAIFNDRYKNDYAYLYSLCQEIPEQGFQKFNTWDGVAVDFADNNNGWSRALEVEMFGIL